MKQYKVGKYFFLSVIGFVIFGAGAVYETAAGSGRSP